MTSRRKMYTVTLETHGPFRQFKRNVAADTISEAWELATIRGAEYNARAKNQCVVHAVAFRGDYQE